MGKLFILEFLEYELRPSEVYGIVRNIERSQRIKVGLVVVDYAQSMKPDTPDENGEVSGGQGNWSQIEDIHRLLRKAGRKLDCAMWSAHQAKEVEKRREIL